MRVYYRQLIDKEIQEFMEAKEESQKAVLEVFKAKQNNVVNPQPFEINFIFDEEESAEENVDELSYWVERKAKMANRRRANARAKKHLHKIAKIAIDNYNPRFIEVCNFCHTEMHNSKRVRPDSKFLYGAKICRAEALYEESEKLKEKKRQKLIKKHKH